MKNTTLEGNIDYKALQIKKLQCVCVSLVSRCIAFQKWVQNFWWISGFEKYRKARLTTASETEKIIKFK